MTDKDLSGWTVMMFAALGGSVDAMKFVLANGGKMTDKARYGATVMMAAAFLAAPLMPLRSFSLTVAASTTWTNVADPQ